MTFIYWCVNENGVKSNFRSQALLDIGLRVPDDNGGTATIVNMDIEKNISIYDDAIDFAIERMMR